MSLIDLNVTNNVATLVLHNAAKRNALSHELIAEFIRALDEAKKQRARAIVIRAKLTSSVWSAGHDVDDIPGPGIDPLTLDVPILQLVRKVQDMPMPVIALVDGTVWGGACELVFVCDMVVAVPTATFALTPARLGVPYNVSSVLNIFKVASPKLVAEMLYTAAPISASRLLTLGVINQIAEPDRIEDVTFSMARAIAANSPMAVAVMKEQLRHLSAAQALSPLTADQIQSSRKQVYMSRDYREGLQAFKEKRPPQFTGE